MPKRQGKFLVMMYVFFTLGSLWPSRLFADVNDEARNMVTGGLTKTSDGIYSDSVTISSVIANLVQALLGLTGIIFVVMTVYAGILYMTAAGDDTKVKKAKGLLVKALIGLIIIASAYTITAFVVTQLGAAVT